MTLDELRALATNTRNGFQCWPAPYQMSPTLEDCEFLYALVRVTKPESVFEYGTGRGVSARFISESIRANGFGMLQTFEPNREYWDDAKSLLINMPVTMSEGISVIFNEPDLVFIDSDYTRRTNDIESFLGRGSAYKGLVVVHDANRRYEGLGQGRGVFLPGSDGLWIGTAGG